jgi:hypothetical protein
MYEHDNTSSAASRAESADFERPVETPARIRCAGINDLNTVADRYICADGGPTGEVEGALHNICSAGRNSTDRELKLAFGSEHWSCQAGRVGICGGIRVLQGRLPRAMDLGPKGDIDRRAVRGQIEEMHEILERDQGVKNIVRTRNALDIEEIVGVRIAPGEGHVVSLKRRPRRRADHLGYQACAAFGARAGGLG